MRPFVSDDNSLLAISLMANKFAQRPSELLEIQNATVALDFDLACTNRLLIYENERDYKRLETLIKSLAAMVGGMFGADPDEEENGEIPTV